MRNFLRAKLNQYISTYTSGLYPCSEDVLKERVVALLKRSIVLRDQDITLEKAFTTKIKTVGHWRVLLNDNVVKTLSDKEMSKLYIASKK